MRKWVCAAALLFVPQAASAHSFKAGAGYYESFIEGTTVVLFWPPTLAAIISIGMLISLWRTQGLVDVWLFLIIGHILGFFLSALPLEGVATFTYGIALVTAIFAASGVISNNSTIRVITALSGLVVMSAALEGHPLGSLPVAIYAGLFFAANLGVAISAGIVSITLEKFTANWMKIGWRVVASWIAAIIILQLAFEMRSAV